MVAVSLAKCRLDASICSLSLLANSLLEGHGEGRSYRSHGKSP